MSVIVNIITVVVISIAFIVVFICMTIAFQLIVEEH